MFIRGVPRRMCSPRHSFVSSSFSQPLRYLRRLHIFLHPPRFPYLLLPPCRFPFLFSFFLLLPPIFYTVLDSFSPSKKNIIKEQMKQCYHKLKYLRLDIVIIQSNSIIQKKFQCFMFKTRNLIQFIIKKCSMFPATQQHYFETGQKN